MIRAPDIDDPFNAAGILVLVVSDVRGKIGGLPVPANNDTVFLVPVGARFEPEGTVVFVYVAVGAEACDDLIDLAGIIQALLAEPFVERDPKDVEIVPDAGQNAVCSDPGTGHDGIAFLLVEEPVAVLISDTHGDIANVVPLVKFFREIYGLSKQFPVAQEDRSPKGLNLTTGIVDVIFSLHRIPAK